MKKSLLVLTVLLLNVSHLLAQVPSYVPTDGLVGWWPFNGNANDESGNGNDGVVNGATLTEDRFGSSNSAYGFDGVDDFIEVAHASSLNLLPITLSVWFNVDSISNGQWLVGKYSCASGNGYSAHLLSGRPSAFYYSGNTEANRIDLDNVSSGYSNIPYETWHQAVLVFDSIGLNYYVDGSFLSFTEFIGNADSIGNPTNTTAPLMFGRYLEGGCFNLPNEYFFLTGSLDDIAIFNRAFTEQEIEALYTGQCPSVTTNCTSLPSNLQQGLVGYWPFCGNANDESGNGNDGTVNGATLTEDRFGNADAAYGFDGVDDDIDITNLSINGDVSVSFWKRIENMNFSYPIGLGVNPIFNLGFGIGIGFLSSGCGYQDSTLFVYDGADGCSNVILSAPFLVEGVWYHTSFVRENGVSKLYENGSLISEGVNLDFPTLSNITFGRRSDNLSPFNGTLDDIAIYNRALTPEEVQELYTLDACTFTIYDTLTVENVINVYDTLTIENIVDVFDTTYIHVEVYDTTYTNIENVIDVYDTTTVVETVFEYDTLTIENIVEVYDTLTVENVIDVYDTTTVVETVLIYDTLTVENVIDVYDTTYVTVTDTLIIDIPSGVGGTILNTLLLYPNPTSDQLTINYGNFAAMAGYSLTIFDNVGSTVHETNITQAQETLNISQWSAGVYQVVVYNTGGVPVETRQIVIQ